MTVERLRFILQADVQTAQARKQIRQLQNEISMATRRANADIQAAVQHAYGPNAIPLRNIKNTQDTIIKNINRGKISANEFGQSMRNLSTIIQEQGRLASGRWVESMDGMRSSTHAGTLTVDDFSKKQITMGHRIAATTTLVRAFSTQIIDYGKNLQWAGRQIVVGFGVPVGFAMLAATRQFREVEKEIIRFRKVFNEELSGIGVQEAEQRITRQARMLIETTGREFTEILSTAGTFAQMGFGQEDIEELTRLASEFATLGETTAETSINLIRGIRGAYQLTNEELEQTVANLNAIENSTSLTLDAMAQSLPQVLSLFNQFNMSVETGAAVVAGMQEILGSATEGVNALKFSFFQILSPTDKAAKAWKDVLNIDLEDLQNRSMGADGNLDIVKLIGEIGKVAAQIGPDINTLSDTLGELIGARQVGRFLTAAISVNEAMESGDPAINNYAKALEAVADPVQAMINKSSELAAVTQSASGQFDILVEQMKAEVAIAGEGLLPILNSILGAAKGMIEWFNGLSDAMKKWVGRLMIGVAAFSAFLMFAGIGINLFGNLIKILSMFFPTMKMWSAETKAQDLILQSLSTQVSNTETMIELLNDALRVQIGLYREAGRVSKIYGSSVYDARVMTQGLITVPTGPSTPLSQGPGRGGNLNVKAGRARMAGGTAALLGGLMMADMAGGGSQLTSALLVATSVMTALPVILRQLQSSLPKIAEAFKQWTGSGFSLKSSLKSMGALLTGAGGIAAGVAVVAAGYMVWRNHTRNVYNETIGIANALNDLNESLGLTGQISEQMPSATKKLKEDIEFLRANADLITLLRTSSSRRRWPEARALLESVQYSMTIAGATNEVITSTIEKLQDAAGIDVVFNPIFTQDGLTRLSEGYVKAMQTNLRRAIINDPRLNNAAIDKNLDQAAQQIAAIAQEDPSSTFRMIQGIAETLAEMGRYKEFSKFVDSLTDEFNAAGIKVDFAHTALQIFGNETEQVAFHVEDFAKAGIFGHQILSQITEETAGATTEMINMAKASGVVVAAWQHLQNNLAKSDFEAVRFARRNFEDALAAWDFDRVLVDEALDVAAKAGGEFGEEFGEAAASSASNYVSQLRSAITDELQNYVKEGMDLLNKMHEQELDNLKDEQKALKEIDDQREQMYLDELERRRRLSDQMEARAKHDIAIATGDLNRAAEIEAQMRADALEENEDNIRRLFEQRAEARDKEFDAREEALKEQQEAEEKSIQERLDEEMKIIPKTLGEWKEKVRRLSSIFGDAGVDIGHLVGSSGEAGWTAAIKNWAAAIKEDIAWDEIGKSVAKKFGGGVLEGLDEVVAMLLSRVSPNSEIPWVKMREALAGNTGYLGGGRTFSPDGSIAYSSPMKVGGLQMHSGGLVPGRGDTPRILEGGEFVIQRDAVNALGAGTLASLNNMQFGADPYSGNPFAGLFGGFLSQMMAPMAMTGLFAKLIGALTSMLANSGLLTSSMATGGGVSAAGFVNPVPGSQLISRFGDARDGGKRSHKGIDLGAPRGTGVYAARGGTIVRSGKGGGFFGNRVWIQSDDFFHAYAHLNNIAGGVRSGVRVGTGQLIGSVGNSGAEWSTPHLHWSINRRGPYSEEGSFDPMKVLSLMKGGRVMFDNTLANLHRGEVVLRRPVAQEFEKNIKSGGAGRDVIVNVNVDKITSDVDINRLAAKVGQVVSREQSRLGTNRGIR